jgi:hypothetical protein
MPEVQLELHAMLRKLHLSGMADNFGDLALKAANARLALRLDRGVWHPLQLPRLEIRRDRRVYPPAIRGNRAS